MVALAEQNAIELRPPSGDMATPRHDDTTTPTRDGQAGGSRDVCGADEGWTNSAGLGGGLGAALAREPTAAALLPPAEGAVTTAVAALGHRARASALVLRRRTGRASSRRGDGAAAAQHLEVRGDAPISSVRPPPATPVPRRTSKKKRALALTTFSPTTDDRARGTKRHRR